MIQRLGVTNLEGQNNQANTRLLSSAVEPLEPSRPKIPLGIAMSILGGLAAGLLAALGMLIAASALLIVGRNDSNPLALYVFLLLLAPPIQAGIAGFGGINRFIDVDYLRLLSVLVLFPTAARLALKPESVRLFRIPSDKYLVGYLTLLLCLQAPVTSYTDLLRSFVALFIDVFLPYYVFSRGLSDFSRMREVFASFTAACALIAVIALFEFFKGWLLYSSLPTFLDAHWSYGHYMSREGALRVVVSTGHPIVLGYVMTVALGLHLALRHAYPNRTSWRLVAFALVAALVVSLSRGPWVGAFAMLGVAIALAPRSVARIGKNGVPVVILVSLLAITPFGAKVVALLPFIGTADSETVAYRQQLFNVAWDVVMMNPFLGSPYYMATDAMEQMRQGEGIIDVVNSYIGVALGSGLVGLALFGAVFVSTARHLFVYLFRHGDEESVEHVTGRALLATLVGVLTIIATASSINAIPVIYWCLAGACAAYVRALQVGTYGEASPSLPRKTGFHASPL